MHYKDKEWLRQKYVVEKLSRKRIAELECVSPGAIYYWLIKFEIPRRKGGVEHWDDEGKEFRRRWNLEHKDYSLQRGKKASQETRLLMSIRRRGEKNANWKGGLTTLTRGVRRSPEYYQWKKSVLERDNKTCQMCGSKDNVHAHHIIPISQRAEYIYDVNNGIALCEKCHRLNTAWMILKPKGRRKRLTRQ